MQHNADWSNMQMYCIKKENDGQKDQIYKSLKNEN